MTPTLNKDDIKLLKGIFATKDDLKKVVSASEKKIIKRVGFMINVLDKDLMKFAKEVDKIKIHVGLPISN